MAILQLYGKIIGENNKFPDIMCQRFTKNCALIDSNFRVNTIIGQRNQAPCIAMDKSGEFVVVWQQDVRDMISFDIEGQKYDSSGIPVGGNFKISEDAAGNIQQKNVADAIKRNKTFVVVWEDFRNGVSDIYGQLCDSSCALVGSNFKINDNTDSSSCEYPSTAIDSDKGNFIVTWTKHTLNTKIMPQIIVQLFDSIGQTEGTNFQLNDADVFPYNQHWSTSKHSVAANNTFCAFSGQITADSKDGIFMLNL